MRIDSIESSILRSYVHTSLGNLLIGSCALWASLAIIEASWHVNPLTKAFAQMVERETVLPH
jgi:hypothetical protein